MTGLPPGGPKFGEALEDGAEVAVSVRWAVADRHINAAVASDLHHQLLGSVWFQVPSSHRAQLGPDRACHPSAVGESIPTEPGVLVPPQLQLGVGDVGGQPRLRQTEDIVAAQVRR